MTRREVAAVLADIPGIRVSTSLGDLDEQIQANGGCVTVIVHNNEWLPVARRPEDGGSKESRKGMPSKSKIKAHVLLRRPIREDSKVGRQ